MNFKQVSELNKERALLWHKGGLDEWTIADWSNAMCGEAGEVANAVKKYRRLQGGLQQNSGPQTFDEAREAIAKEIGDTYLYLDLLAQVLGIDIQDAIVSTFNRVSKREGFPQMLPVETESEICGRCEHEIEVHGLFTGCKVLGCQCSQFHRGECRQ